MAWRHLTVPIKRRHLLLALLVWLLLTSAVVASSSVTLYPATIARTVLAGETVQQQITIRNDSDVVQTFTVVISDYDVDEASTTVTYLPLGSRPDSVKAMLEVSPVRFDLEAGAERVLTVQIRPKATTPPGNYKGVLAVQTTQADDPVLDETSLLGVTASVGSLIGVTVQSEPTASAANGGVGRVLASSSAVLWSVSLVLLGILILVGLRWRRRRGK